MPKKGETNNPNGRPKGTPNKATQELRDKIKTILEGQKEDIEKALNELKKDNPAQYLAAMDKLMAYVVPKKRDITSDDKSFIPSVTITENRDQSK